MDAYVVWIKVPERKLKEPASIELTRQQGSQRLLEALWRAMGAHLDDCVPGTVMSVQLAMGREPSADEPDPPCSRASFVLDSPETEERKADRHEWEFIVEKRDAQQVPLADPL